MLTQIVFEPDSEEPIRDELFDTLPAVIDPEVKRQDLSDLDALRLFFARTTTEFIEEAFADMLHSDDVDSLEAVLRQFLEQEGEPVFSIDAMWATLTSTATDVVDCVLQSRHSDMIWLSTESEEDLRHWLLWYALVKIVRTCNEG